VIHRDQLRTTIDNLQHPEHQLQASASDVLLCDSRPCFETGCAVSTSAEHDAVIEIDDEVKDRGRGQSRAAHKRQLRKTLR
jgi:hypothetical protein